MTTDVLLEWLIKSAIILFVLVTAVAYLTFLERKVMSWIQLRIGPNRVGPNLYGIVGDHKGEGRGFNFSAALKAKGGTWTDDDLNKFIASPKGFVPGTAMGFAGIPKDSERADVIAYLHTLSDNPVPLPTASK